MSYHRCSTTLLGEIHNQIVHFIIIDFPHTRSLATMAISYHLNNQMPNLPSSKLIKMLHPIPVTNTKPIQVLNLYYIQSTPKEERVNTACTISAYKNVCENASPR